LPFVRTVVFNDHHLIWNRLDVQAIIVAIDQYAEAALGDRGYFLNRPHRIG
jgi:hypothetical protein